MTDENKEPTKHEGVDAKEPVVEVDVKEPVAAAAQVNDAGLKTNEKRPTFVEDKAIKDATVQLVLKLGEISEAEISKMFPTGLDGKDLKTFIAAQLRDSIREEHYKPKGVIQNIIEFLDEDDNTKFSGISKSRSPLTNNVVSGADAVLAITSSLGIDSVTQVPLVNSGGFRVKLSAPDADDLIVLDEQIIQNKGELGRLTYGSSMAFNQVYITRDVTNLILNKIIKTNLAGVDVNNKAKLRELISIEDYPALIAGLLEAYSPDGIDSVVPCGDCGHSTVGKTKASRMYHVDHGKLSEYNLEILTRNIDTPVSIAEVEKYKELLPEQSNTFSVSVADGARTIEFTLENPSIDKHVAAGHQWASNINNTVKKYLNASESSDEVSRKRILSKLLQVNVLTQFASWIKSIKVIDPSTNNYIEVEDSKGINGTLRKLLDAGIAQEVYDKINEFVENDNPVTIGVPNFVCPSCKKPAGTGGDELIPIDVQMLFFIQCIGEQVVNVYIEAMDLYT